MPELWTWWIENGPTSWTSSPRASVARDELLRQLVGAERGDGDGGEAEPLAVPAPSERSAAEIGRSASVDEPTRTSGASGRRAEPAPSPRLLPRVVDAERRPGERLEPLDRDRLAADRAGAVRPRLDPLRARRRLGGADPAAFSSSASSSSRSKVTRRRIREVVVGTSSDSLARRPPSATGPRCRGARSAPEPVALPLAARSRNRSVSMLTRPPVRPRWRAAARSRPARYRRARRSCHGRRRPKRASRSPRDRERLGEQRDDGLVRLPALRRRG